MIKRKTKPLKAAFNTRLTSSLYYNHLLKTAVLVTTVLVVLTIISSLYSLVTYHWTGSTHPRYVVSVIIFTLSTTIMIGGGFVFGLLINRHLPRKERIVMAGAYGLLAQSFYLLAFAGLLWIVFHFFGVRPAVTTFGPFIALAATVLIAGALRLSRLNATKILMGIFVAIFIARQVNFVAEIARVFAGRGSEVVATTIPLWPLILGILVSPIVISLAFYAVLSRVGRLARLFYATFFATAIEFFAASLFSFITGLENDNTWFLEILYVVVTSIAVIVLLARLVRLRRLTT